jgi:type IV secretion system protein VirB6
MTLSCPNIASDTGAIAATLQAVDCQSRVYAQSGYESLAATGSPFQAWLTAFLIIYVALLGWRLLLGGTGRVSELPLTALKIGAILAMVSNWSLFQTLVFDLVTKTPIELTRLITASSASQSSLVGDPLGGLQVAHDQLTLSAAAFGKAVSLQVGPLAGGNAAASQALWQASQLLFLSTAGLFSAAMIAVAILTALGPLFVSLFLLAPTRDLFIGWVRALLAAMLAPMLAWMASALMLMVLEPNLIALARDRIAGDLHADTAMATAGLITIFALVQTVLAGLGVFIAAGFKLSRSAQGQGAQVPVLAERHTDRSTRLESVSRTEQLAAALNRSAAMGGRSLIASGAAPRSWSSAEFTPARDPLGSFARRPQVRARQDFGGGKSL